MPVHVSSTCARNMYRHEMKLVVKQILCIKFVKYWDKKRNKCYRYIIEMYVEASKISGNHFISENEKQYI